MGKAKAVNLKNWDEATARLAEYRAAVCALDKKQAALEDAVRKVQESYQLEIDGLRAEVKEFAGDLRAFAELHGKQDEIAPWQSHLLIEVLFDHLERKLFPDDAPR